MTSYVDVRFNEEAPRRVHVAGFSVSTMPQHQNGEFWMLPKNVAQHPSLELVDKLVFAVLWTRRNGENKAWPGQKTIAESIGASPRSIVRAIRRLETAGLIVKHRVGKRATNRYVIPDGVVPPRHFTNDTMSLHRRHGGTSNSKRTYKRTKKGEIVLKDGTKAVFHKGAWRPTYDLSKVVSSAYLPNV